LRATSVVFAADSGWTRPRTRGASVRQLAGQTGSRVAAMLPLCSRSVRPRRASTRTRSLELAAPMYGQPFFAVARRVLVDRNRRARSRPTRSMMVHLATPGYLCARSAPVAMPRAVDSCRCCASTSPVWRASVPRAFRNRSKRRVVASRHRLCQATVQLLWTGRGRSVARHEQDLRPQPLRLRIEVNSQLHTARSLFHSGNSRSAGRRRSSGAWVPRRRRREERECKSRTPLFSGVPNLDFPGMPVTPKQHFHPHDRTLLERCFVNLPPGRRARRLVDATVATGQESAGSVFQPGTG
jgi:hypothetical protein